jgi:hypothetical protein
MGGKSGPSNNQAVQLQMQLAQEAKDKENARQARLNQGKSAIDSIFGNDNFGDPFYNKYQQAELDYTLPQLQTQYTDAKRTAEADLARAGLLRSGAAGYVQGKLATQQGVNEAGLRAKADTDTAALRQSIAAQQQQAYNQLYATEDPTVAANTAANSAANAQLQQPNVSALGDMFKPIAIGLGSAIAPAVGQSEANRQLAAASGRGQGNITTTPGN